MRSNDPRQTRDRAVEEMRERLGPGEVRLGHLPVGLGHADTVQMCVQGFEFGGGHLLLQ
jgi:hypothetical protein